MQDCIKQNAELLKTAKEILDALKAKLEGRQPSIALDANDIQVEVAENKSQSQPGAAVDTENDEMEEVNDDSMLLSKPKAGDANYDSTQSTK